MSGKNGFKLEGTVLCFFFLNYSSRWYNLCLLEARKIFFYQNWTILYVCGRHKSQRYKFERFDVASVQCAIMGKKQTLLLIEERNAQSFQTSGRNSFLESI